MFLCLTVFPRSCSSPPFLYLYQLGVRGRSRCLSNGLTLSNQVSSFQCPFAKILSQRLIGWQVCWMAHLRLNRSLGSCKRTPPQPHSSCSTSFALKHKAPLFFISSPAFTVGALQQRWPFRSIQTLALVTQRNGFYYVHVPGGKQYTNQKPFHEQN